MGKPTPAERERKRQAKLARQRKKKAERSNSRDDLFGPPLILDPSDLPSVGLRPRVSEALLEFSWPAVALIPEPRSVATSQAVIEICAELWNLTTSDESITSSIKAVDRIRLASGFVAVLPINEARAHGLVDELAKRRTRDFAALMVKYRSVQFRDKGNSELGLTALAEFLA